MSRQSILTREVVLIAGCYPDPERGWWCNVVPWSTLLAGRSAGATSRRTAVRSAFWRSGIYRSRVSLVQKKKLFTGEEGNGPSGISLARRAIDGSFHAHDPRSSHELSRGLEPVNAASRSTPRSDSRSWFLLGRALGKLTLAEFCNGCACLERASGLMSGCLRSGKWKRGINLARYGSKNSLLEIM